MSPLQVTESRGVKVYNVSSGKTLPQWLSEKKKKSLRKDEEYKSRIELIQDFEFDVASQRLRLSRDGKFLAATGVYPPQVKVYEVGELSMKFERHMDCEVVQFDILSDDYSKMVFLQADRTVELHAKFGTYYKTRVPKTGRDMVYDPVSCDLIIGGSSSDVYRLNLEQGRFLKPYSVLSEAVNCLDRSAMHGLIAMGTEAGSVECWDPRSRRRAGVVDVAAAVSHGVGTGVARDEGTEVEEDVTAVRFDPDGLKLAAGTRGGFTALYDLRSSRPLSVKDQQYGQAIIDVRFHKTPEGSYLLASDKKILKVWDNSVIHDSEALFASIEPPTDINEACVCPGSGLIMFATEQPRMHVYFVPALGPAPKWCSFLDSLTEELEESKRSEVYEDYRFVTREELLQLGLGGLVGTNMVKAYMHGFFIDAQLYARSKAVAQPFAYDEYRKQKVREKVDGTAQQRIAIKEPLPKVNQDLAKLIMERKQESQALLATLADGKAPKVKTSERDKARKAQAQAKLLEDDRFSALFAQKEFEIDSTSAEYKLLHPSDPAAEASGKRRQVDDNNFDDNNFDAVQGLDSDSAHEDDDDDDALDVAAVAGAARKVQNGQWGNTSTKGAGKMGKSKMSKRNQLTMFEVRGGHEAAVLRPTGQGAVVGESAGGGGGKRAKTLSLADRLASGAGGRVAELAVVGSLSGNKEIDWTPRDKGDKGDKGDKANKGPSRPGDWRNRTSLDALGESLHRPKQDKEGRSMRELMGDGRTGGAGGRGGRGGRGGGRGGGRSSGRGGSRGRGGGGGGGRGRGR